MQVFGEQGVKDKIQLYLFSGQLQKALAFFSRPDFYEVGACLSLAAYFPNPF